MIRVFVVDDSAFVRRALTRVLALDPQVRVVGEARSAEDALAQIPAINPDVVTLDVQMDGLDGLQLLKALLEWRPTLPVIMLSAHTHEGAAATAEALALGAVGVIDKGAFSPMDLDGLGRRTIDTIRHCSRLRPRRETVLTQPATHLPDMSHCEVIVIGASTGGPPALQKILEYLPASFPLPILVAQHMPPGFTDAFARRLNGLCRIQVREAVENEALRPATALIAPAGKHMRLTRKGTIALSDEAQGEPHRPSVNVLMNSAASARPGRVLGVLLTGMGDDGADAMCLVRAQGGVTLGESEESCVVYGMSRAAHERGGVSALLPLGQLAEVLRSAGDSSANC